MIFVMSSRQAGKTWAARVGARIAEDIKAGDLLPDLDPPLSVGLWAALRGKGLAPVYEPAVGWVARPLMERE